MRQLQRVKATGRCPQAALHARRLVRRESSGLRQLQVRRYPTASIASSAEVDADTHEAKLA